MLGLTSVTFRRLSAEAVIEVAVGAGLAGIEWGSDVHVPQSDLANARRIGEATRAAGLAVTSLGSYYRLGCGEDFTRYAATAVALGAPLVRIWAGTQGSASVPPEERARLAQDARRVADIAAAHGLTVAFEYHPGTLTDDSASAVALMQEVAHPAFRLYWQPDYTKSPDALRAGLEAARPYLGALHVFCWHPDHRRRPLAEGASQWREWLALVPEARALPCLLEFVPEDDPAILPREADALRAILSPKEDTP